MVLTWDTDTGQCLRKFVGHGDDVLNVSVTPNGRCVVSAGGDNYSGHMRRQSLDNTLRVWDLQSGRCLRTLAGHTDTVQSVSVTPDSRRVVSGSRDNTLRVWDLESGHCLRVIEGYNYLATGMCVTPEGRRVVSGSLNNTLRVWDLESGQCLRTLAGHADNIAILCLTPNGQRAVSGGGNSYRFRSMPGEFRDNMIRVWDLESGQCLLKLDGHRDEITGVNFTPDGRRLVSSSHDCSLRVWDLESGRCLHTLTDHCGYTPCVRVAPDGRQMVSGSWDATLALWDLNSGNCLAVYSALEPIVAVVVVGRGNKVCVGTKTGSVFFLDVCGLEPGAALKPDVVPDTSDDSYQQLLRRGLEFSRREKGNKHEETLAHLIALASHLERMGNPAEAGELQRECDTLTPRVFTRKQKEAIPRIKAEGLECQTVNSSRVFVPALLAQMPREITLAERRESALRLFQKGYWEAAASDLQKFLDAGEPLAEHGPKLIACLLNAHESRLESDVKRIETLLQELEKAGHANLAAPLREQLQSMLLNSDRKWWKIW
jgi:WD40 repeat protein